MAVGVDGAAGGDPHRWRFDHVHDYQSQGQAGAHVGVAVRFGFGIDIGGDRLEQQPAMFLGADGQAQDAGIGVEHVADAHEHRVAHFLVAGGGLHDLLDAVQFLFFVAVQAWSVLLQVEQLLLAVFQSVQFVLLAFGEIPKMDLCHITHDFLLL